MLTSKLSLINLVDLRVAKLVEVPLDQGWGVEDFVQQCNVMFAVLSGRARVAFRTGETLMEAGRLYILPVHAKVNCQCLEEGKMIAVRFRIALPTGHDVLDGIETCLEPDTGAEELLAALHQLEEESNFQAGLQLHILLANCITQFVDLNLERHQRLLRSFGKYGKIYNFVEGNCGAGITVEELARMMNMTPSNLSAQFKSDTGTSLKAYLTARVLEQACDLLILTDWTVKQIANELGFSDTSYFSRFFKKHTDMSPLEYRSAEVLRRPSIAAAT